MTLVARHAALTDIGLHRRSNEDRFIVAPPLFAVCDGMGGAEAGEVAAGLAVETLAARFAAGEGIVAAARAANAAVYARASERREESGMGTTLTALVVDEDQGHFAHVGDSRAYRLRDGVLEQLSADHSLVGEMVREGRLTPEEAAAHPHRSVLSRALGTEAEVEIDRFSVDLRSGDVLLLCSDGLTSEVSDDEIREMLGAATPAEAARALVDAARAAGGHDNVTVVVIRIEEGDETDASADPGGADVRGADVRGGEGAAVTGAGGAPAPVTAAPSKTPAPRAARRRLITLVVVLALVALLGLAGVVVVNTCYFVGVDDGTLAVYSGLPWSIGPLELHSIYLRSTRPYVLLDESERALVDAHEIHSKDEALRLAEELGMVP
ncbi:MAG TPA: Stp1/IreP family PP2C-type Ser/Thr phosphatase [Thermoleophilia bacterium]|nr:Stp1/IreP family PP2C-type Ser/Thr phosphatase [Thermoleophilia bacterium]HQG03408.1 Stp1/IreP family PP2C-type Ser/Thr phosphatase [Thermoleophilia bacterium]HQJ97697.1 Stp1/IreP family PP2C-type Ser/Thr phosphatase [Thermoleophilia bacterium]